MGCKVANLNCRSSSKEKGLSVKGFLSGTGSVKRGPISKAEVEYFRVFIIKRYNVLEGYTNNNMLSVATKFRLYNLEQHS